MSKITHVNVTTGQPLKAANLAALDGAMRARRFKAPQWATYQQWKGTGRTVKPGETGVTLQGASGFSWRVFNVAQTAEGGAEAARARAPVAPRPATPAARKAQPVKRAPELKKVPSAPSALAATAKPVAQPVSQSVATPERVASVIRCNKRLAITDSEARGVIVKYPGRTFFDPHEVAAIYDKADTSRQATFRRSEGERWLKLCRQEERRNPAKIGKARTRAWVIFTGRAEELKPGSKPAAKPVTAATVEPPAPVTPAPSAAVVPMNAKPLTWRERFAERFGIRRAA